MMEGVPLIEGNLLDGIALLEPSMTENLSLPVGNNASSETGAVNGNNPHPLLMSIVMENVFRNLVEDAIRDPQNSSLADIRSHRLVCRDWNEEITRMIPDFYECCSSQDAQKLFELVSNPNAPTPFLRNLHLRYNEAWKHPDTYKLLWTVQNTLKVLEITATELDYCVFMLLPKICPHLQSLVLDCVDIYPTVDFEALHPFEDIWRQPLCNLKSLKITRGSISQNGAKLIIALMDKVKSIDSLEIKTNDRYDTGNSSKALEILGTEMVSNSALIGRLKNFKLENKYSTSLISGMTQGLQMMTTPLHTTLHTLSFVQKTGSLFLTIPIRDMEVTISSLVHATSQTLKHLTVVNSSETSAHLFHEFTVGKIVFPLEMPKLEFLCLGNVGLRMISEPSKRSIQSFSTLFPNLKHFEFWIRIFSDLSDADKTILFQTLFPMPQEGTDGKASIPPTLKTLKNFHLYTRLKIEHEPILREIPLKFHSLRSIMLELDWGLLSVVIDGFKDLDIQQFTLVYYEGENEVMEFDSGITGIPMNICVNIHNAQEFQAGLDVGEFEDVKRNSALSDWKRLERFNISYRHGGVFDIIFLTFGLQLMRNLKHLELRHFDIKENILIRLIKKTDLATLTLGNCRILPLDEQYPIFNDEWGIEDVVKKHDKDVKISFAGYGESSDNDSVPFYATLLNNFEYDNQDWLNMGG